MLPTNINGDPEYATVVLNLHRTDAAISPTEHVTLTTSKSTRTPEEEVGNLAEANGDAALILSPRNRRLLSEGGWKDVVYVYRPRSSPSTAHLVIGSGAYRSLIDASNFGRGSNLVADWRLFEEVAAEEAAYGRNALAVLLVDDLLEEAQQAA